MNPDHVLTVYCTIRGVSDVLKEEVAKGEYLKRRKEDRIRELREHKQVDPIRVANLKLAVRNAELRVEHFANLLWVVTAPYVVVCFGSTEVVGYLTGITQDNTFINVPSFPGMCFSRETGRLEFGYTDNEASYQHQSLPPVIRNLPRYRRETNPWCNKELCAIVDKKLPKWGQRNHEKLLVEFQQYVESETRKHLK